MTNDRQHCSHPAVERVGGMKDGQAVINLECTECPAIVHEDVQGRVEDFGSKASTIVGDPSNRVERGGES